MTEDVKIYSRRRRAAARTELAGSVTAGSVGVGLGAAKLRDAHVESYPGHLQHLVNREAGKAKARGVSPERVARNARRVMVGTPGRSFKALAIATAGGVTAASASHYGDHLKAKRAKQLRREAVGKAAELGRLPRYVIHAGQRKRVLGMHDKDNFRVLDHDDSVRIVHRSRVQFPRPVKIRKSELDDGRFKPANKLTRTEREAVRTRAVTGARPHPRTPMPGKRGVAAVYEGYGAGPGIPKARDAKTRPSAVHRNVHYGESVNPKLERKIDRSLNRKQVAGIKGPVAFHRGETMAGALAGAAPAHVTTRHVGQVILNENMISANGRTFAAGNASFRHVINHELAHTTPRGNPRAQFTSDGAIKRKRAMGEEARADATGVPRTGIYRRNRAVMSRPVANVIGRKMPAGLRQTELGEGVDANRHYHEVHRKVRRASGQPSSATRDFMTSALRGKRSKKVLALAAVGAVGEHERRKRGRVSKAVGVSGRGRETVDMTGQRLGKRLSSLHDMVYDEVSTVDIPAAQDALIMITKRHEGADMAEEFEGPILDAEGTELEESELEDGQVIFNSEGRAFQYASPEIDDAAREPELAIAKAANPLLGLGQRQVAKRAVAEPAGDLAEAISKALGDAKSDAERDSVIKSFAGVVSKMQERIDTVEEIAKAEREVREIGQYTEVAKQLGIPGVTPEEFGPVLKRAADLLDPADTAILAKALDATSGVLYEEFGYDGFGPELGDPETADAEAYAADAVAKSRSAVAKSAGGDPDSVESAISKAAAMEMYYQSNGDAYDAYLAGRPR